MFDKRDFLRRVLEKAGKQAAICEALDLPSSRVSEIYRALKDNPPGKPRDLTMEEAMAMSEAFGVPIQPVSAEKLKPILDVLLRYPPKGGWASDQGVQRLAGELEYGIGLLHSAPANPSQDAMIVVARAIADRLHNGRD